MGTWWTPTSPPSPPFWSSWTARRSPTRGDWLPYLLGVFLCAVTAVTILFADELFRFQLSFRILQAENAEPTDWELFGRYAGWTVLPIAALVIFALGLQ